MVYSNPQYIVLHSVHLLQGKSEHRNPHGIVSIGPDLDFNAPHDRATKFSKL